MSEPFTLYDKDGKVVISHSPYVALEMVEQGELFVVAPEKPAKTVATKKPRVSK